MDDVEGELLPPKTESASESGVRSSTSRGAGAGTLVVVVVVVVVGRGGAAATGAGATAGVSSFSVAMLEAGIVVMSRPCAVIQVEIERRRRRRCDASEREETGDAPSLECGNSRLLRQTDRQTCRGRPLTCSTCG